MHSLDESLFVRLKSIKKSSDSITNIDPNEKAWCLFEVKTSNLVKPLLYLSRRISVRRRSRVQLRHDKAALKNALKLWAALFRDISRVRRFNIHQIYPKYDHLVDNARLFTDPALLFGPSFIRGLVDQASTDQTLTAISGTSTTQGPRSLGPSRNRPFKNNGEGFRNQSQRGNFRDRCSFFQASIVIPPTFAGRVSSFWRAWSGITSDPWVLNLIQSGLSIDFITDPHQEKIPRTPALSEEHSAICDSEVTFLLSKGALVEAVQNGFISTIFVIPKKSGGFRPIINLKALNEFVEHNHFKMEGIHTLRRSLRPDDWLAKLDLQDAYLTIPCIIPAIFMEGEDL